MSDTKIEWTDRTWSPTTGCTKVSPGCDHCYAEGIAHRFAGSKAFPNGFAVTLHPERLGDPLRWRKPGLTFVNSMSDLWHADIPDEFIAAVWCAMYWTSHLARPSYNAPRQTFQILSKRHARMRSWVRGWGNRDQRAAWVEAAQERGWCDAEDRRDAGFMPAVLPNVWLGASVEDQQRADLRIPALLDTPAAVRFLSCEPLLGSVDVTPWLDRIDWVIAGGESGPGARPMHPDWARQLRDQCTSAGVPFFFKQWGEWGPAPWSVRVCDPAVGWTGTDAEQVVAKLAAEDLGATHCVMNGGHLYEPDHKTWSLERVGEQAGAVRRWGKKAAGRELDGRTWDEYPAVTP